MTYQQLHFIIFCASIVHVSDADALQTGHSLCRLECPYFHIIFSTETEIKDSETSVLLPANLSSVYRGLNLKSRIRQEQHYSCSKKESGFAFSGSTSSACNCRLIERHLKILRPSTIRQLPGGMFFTLLFCT